MIRIEDFLFRENIEPSQSESLISRFPNLSFGTTDEFYSYFNSQNIRLVKIKQSNIDDSLLEKFKNFKTSSDYASVKVYIKNQKKIRDAIASNDIAMAASLLGNLSSVTINPFFDFVVRKILTGSDTGVLPSETLKTLLDKQNQNNSEIQLDTDVIRDYDGTIQSFKNYLKNKGTLQINLLDERFLIDSFNYTVNTTFNQLDDAIAAEENILKKADELKDISTETGSLLDNLQKLIIEDSSSIPALQNKVETLNSQVSNLQELVEFKDESLSNSDRVIEELSIQRNKLVSEIDSKDKTIIELSSTIDTKLKTLESDVKSQLENSGNAFDELSKKLEEQQKKAEENSTKQLEAFQSAIGNITSALKPKEPETPTPSPGDSPEEKRRKEKIQKIQEDWDKIKYISTSTDDTLDAILKKVGSSIGSNRSKFVDLTGSLTSRVSQVYNWNTMYKDQYKYNLNTTTIKTEKDADEIIKLMASLLTTQQMETPVRKFLYDSITGDVFDQWRDDVNRTKGSNSSKVKDICGLVGVRYDENSTQDLENKLRASTFDTIIEVLGIVNEFPSKDY